MMAAATVSSAATTAAAPPALAPALASRQPSVSIPPTPSAASPSPLTPNSVTTKEWVIPPRPKPGRKPAVDTPPTKRKAQNRAAQRAFRERRAARVGELEEQIRKIEDENERDEEALQAKITDLSSELERRASEISWWKERCRLLEKDIAVERSAKEALVKEFRSSMSEQRDEDRENTPPTPRRSSRKKPSISMGQKKSLLREIEVAPEIPYPQMRQGSENPFNGTRTSEIQEISYNTKRPQVIHTTESTKRSRPDLTVKPDPEEMEIDFTSRFASAPDAATTSNAPSPSTFDRCGFCQDGTPCICAEMAAEEETEKNNARDTRLAPIQNFSQFTPPPSDGDVRSELTLPPINNPCANGPGTCAQCVADPRSTLFCKSLAAARSSAGGSNSGCCGGKGSGPSGGCCQSRPDTRNSTKPNNATQEPSSRAVSLSCADAFTTLSRHPNFSRANDELGSWLPRLQTLPNPQEVAPKDNQGQITDSRPAMEVEAASVMGVLRYFDRRFSGNK
ncbi:hypothetical protein FQN54_005334 [Arachnomyces sp. PD_36]|nr:hypothetical protein FQN54_005334 [Arachnomyces sp. PD_36]